MNLDKILSISKGKKLTIAEKLFTEVSCGNIKRVENILTTKKIDIDFADNEGNTLLMYAVLGSDEKMVEYLIKKGANINLKNKWGNTALTLSLRIDKTLNNTSDKGITKILLDNGAIETYSNVLTEEVIM